MSQVGATQRINDFVKNGSFSGVSTQASPNSAQSPATAPDWPAGPMSRSATRRPGPLADQRNVVCPAGAPSASARSRTMLSGRPSSASLLSFAQSGMASAAYSVSVRNAVTRTAAPSGPARSASTSSTTKNSRRARPILHSTAAR